MADNFIRIQRWDNGVLVEDYTIPKSTEQYNSDTITEQALQAMIDNRTFIDTPNGDITNAMAVGQIKDLSRQNNKIIRMLLQQFDDVD